MSGPHILVVCTANICRSPVGEALLRAQLQQAGFIDWTVSSAGTWAEGGHPASQLSVTLLEERGLDIHRHCSQRVNGLLLAQCDLVLCMETTHQKDLREAFPAHRAKIYTLRQMVDERGSVRDPYGGSRRQYERMVTEVELLIEAGFPRIQKLAWENYQKRGEDGSR
ncbi:MAG: low molecular weight protein arginine phosphatase [Anaerolineae bacterium]|jgi:protein-tyrosine phosphatase|nr:low molecular weight protein arginine phosphatase [Anaerolineae bacterium]